MSTPKKGTKGTNRRLKPIGKKAEVVSILPQNVVEVPELTEAVKNRIEITITQKGERSSKKGAKVINNQHSFFETTYKAVDTKMLSDFIAAKMLQHTMLNRASGKVFDRTLPITIGIKVETIDGTLTSEAGLEFSTTPSKMLKIFADDAPLHLREAFNPTTFTIGVTMDDIQSWMQERKILIAPEIRENKALAEVVTDNTEVKADIVAEGGVIVNDGQIIPEILVD